MNKEIAETCLPTGQLLQLVLGDITAETTQAIVNAANSHLKHGSGVAGEISRRGGPQIQAESNTWVIKHGPVGHAEPAWTGAGNLPCRVVIHAVGPVWGVGDEDQKLFQAVSGSLRLADELGLESISFPAISTGVFGFPMDRAAGILLLAIPDYFKSKPNTVIGRIRFVLHDTAALGVFLDVWHDHFNA